jgi:hypothetical protein
MTDEANTTTEVPKSPKYVIQADSLTGLIARFVYLHRLENPGIGEFSGTCLEGTKFKFTFGKKPPEARCRKGIEIDGARLG